MINQREQDEATGVCVSDVFSVSTNLYHQMCAYAYTYCERMYMCVYQEQMLNFAAVRVGAHGAAAASPLSDSLLDSVSPNRQQCDQWYSQNNINNIKNI